jgi:hypothetical protein
MPDWTPGKQKRVCLILGLILLLTASFLTFDWTQYWFGIVRTADPERLYSRIAKTLTSLLVAMLALSVGDDGIDDKDPIRLRRVFAAILAGDLLFLLDEIHPAFDYPAILAFLVAHVLIIVRNGHGLRAYWRQAASLRERAVDVALGAGIVLVTGSLFIFTLLEHLAGSPLLYVLLVYAVFLVASLWTGWMSLRIGYFPRANAVLIAAGATSFFIGDYLVGFNLSLQPSPARTTTVFLTWVFYAPAIILLALSGYRWTARRAARSGRER